MGRLAQYERFLVARLLEGLSRIPGVQIFGITDPARLGERAPTVSIAWPPYQPEAIARWLGQHQLFTTHGDHYAPGLMERLGLQKRGGTLRIGLAHYNRASEVDLVLELLAGYRP
jgi:selenocysteine lyase/cysteine desulfurase